MGKSTTYTRVGPTGGSTQTTITEEKKGNAWVWSPSKKKYVQPPKPTSGGPYVWNDNQGWITQNYVASKFGVTAKLLNSPGAGDLKDLFARAWAAEKAGAEWSPDKWNAELKNTKWFQNQSETARKFAILFAVDPQEYARQRDQREEYIKRIAAKTGATLEGNDLREYTLRSLQLGMTDEQIQTMLAPEIGYVGQGEEKRLTGGAYEIETELRDWATKNGVSFTDGWFLDNVKAIAKGEISIGNAKQYVTKMAKQTYSAYADSIDAQSSTLDAGAHFAQTISTMLGVPIGTVSMNNPVMKKLMLAKDEKGNAIDIEAAKQMIRETDDWSNSKTGREEINSISQGILSQFGLM